MAFTCRRCKGGAAFGRPPSFDAGSAGRAASSTADGRPPSGGMERGHGVSADFRVLRGAAAASALPGRGLSRVGPPRPGASAKGRRAAIGGSFFSETPASRRECKNLRIFYERCRMSIVSRRKRHRGLKGTSGFNLRTVCIMCQRLRAPFAASTEHSLQARLEFCSRRVLFFGRRPGPWAAPPRGERGPLQESAAALLLCARGRR